MTSFRFGEFEADDSKFELRRDGEAIRIQRIVLETILFLVQSRGRAVTKADLMGGPWRGHKVSDAAVSRAVMLARRALDDCEGRLIVTVHGVGYRFVAPVTEAAGDDGGDKESAVKLRVQGVVVDVDELPSTVPQSERKAELDTLGRALSKSHQGRGRLVLVKGDAGVGKTTLVEHFAASCAARGVAVAWGRAWDSRGAPPLWHWLEVTRSCGHFLHRADSGADASALRAEHSALTDELRGFSSLAGSREELRVLDLATQFFAHFARSRPLMIVLEGLQDADEGSLRLLEFVRQRLREMPLLVIATTRPWSFTRDGASVDERAAHVHVLQLPAQASSGK
jgi:DNA-binding winged helix-turn-helix (wHTH) protein